MTRTLRQTRNGPRYKSEPKHRPNPERIYLGIDGEGQNINGIHQYVLLAACNEEGTRRWWIEDRTGLSTERCLTFISTLPVSECRIFAYSFGYDLTKILQGIDDELLYRLFRPELRRGTSKGKIVTRPVYWPSGNPKFSLNLLNTRFTVKRRIGTKPNGKPQFGPTVTINDIWKFFQGKFTSALENWKTAPQEVIDRMEHMKNKRSEFDKESPEDVRRYCFSECQYMAKIARQLTEAHIKAEIPLKNYYGAGSSATAMLTIMGIKDVIKTFRESNPAPEEMRYAFMSAFFGGRFENSVIGRIEQPVHSWDISSAYPYQLYHLPCLLHGTWKRTNDYNHMISARAALVRYKLNDTHNNSWGPFPFRLSDGSIVYPRSSGGGWIWRNEFLQGARLFDGVQYLESYVYDSNCECHPFRKIAEYYSERCRIGKEGSGIVLKLGCNSCYGKMAQFIGGSEGQFTNWIWAGMITSGCRAQLLELMGLHKDMANVLMVATDGLCSTEYVEAPKPSDTGTSSTGKPLGGWEYKAYERGMFLARPGIYFPLTVDEKNAKTVRARGIGRGTLVKHWNRIIEAYERGDKTVTLDNLSRFIGAKSAINKSTDSVGNPVYSRSINYGQWITRPSVTSFDPMPKRECVENGNRLRVRRLDGLESQPYKKDVMSMDAILARVWTEALEEQPNLEFGEE